MTVWHKQAPFAVIDFETTGADPLTCMPVQMAVVAFENGKDAAGWSTLIDPGIPIPDEASAIHGITNEMVKGAPTIADAMADAAEQAANMIPCGYNGQSFDRVIWERFADSLGPWVDPLVMVRHADRWVKGKGRHKLTATCQRWGVELTNAHDAAADCVATGQLLFSPKMREMLGNMTLAELLERQEKRRAQQDADFQSWLAKQPKRNEDDNG